MFDRYLPSEYTRHLFAECRTVPGAGVPPSRPAVALGHYLDRQREWREAAPAVAQGKRAAQPWNSMFSWSFHPRSGI